MRVCDACRGDHDLQVVQVGVKSGRTVRPLVEAELCLPCRAQVQERFAQMLASELGMNEPSARGDVIDVEVLDDDGA